jgi:hypothetical protein
LNPELSSPLLSHHQVEMVMAFSPSAVVRFHV